jgi:EAL domain-containing protein (putative c-di-GMP-specific phosphodiesterase class I)
MTGSHASTFPGDGVQLASGETDSMSGQEWIGVTLISDRRHVLEKAAAAADAPQSRQDEDDRVHLIGPRWLSDLAAALEGLPYGERKELYAVLLESDSSRISAVPMRADRALQAARTPWLPRLLDRNHLFPHFQPIVSLADGSTYGHEALIRGRVDDEVMSGGAIFDAARAHRRQFELELRCRTVALERGQALVPEDQKLFVNLDTSGPYDPDTCMRTTRHTARRVDFPMDRICFELIGAGSFPDVALLYRLLDAYRAEGVSIALTDLGASNSLGWLRRVRPEIVKLDKGLVYGLDTDPAREELIRALVEYAHELGIRVVAEGIETSAELAVVRRLGADYGQGWYLGHPEPEPVEVDPQLVTGPAEPVGS